MKWKDNQLKEKENNLEMKIQFESLKKDMVIQKLNKELENLKREQ